MKYFLLIIIFLSSMLNAKVLEFNLKSVKERKDTILYKDSPSYHCIYQNYRGILIPQITKYFENDNFYPENLSFKILSKKFLKRCIFKQKKDSLFRNYDNTPMKILFSGLKRGKGVAKFQYTPFFFKKDSLFFIEKLEYDYKDTKLINKPKTVNCHRKYDLLIISPENFKSELYKYKYFKERNGVKTKVVSLDKIDSTFSFLPSLQVKIREFIKKEYLKYNIKYVILGASFTKIPVKCMDFNYMDYKVGTDMYYGNLDGSFTQEELEGYGAFDFIPEVAVGRFPCSSVSEIKNYVNKAISYYTNLNNANIDKIYLQGFIINEGNPVYSVNYCEIIRKSVVDILSSKKMYQIETPNITKNQVLNNLCSGYNIVYSQSHGRVDKIGVKNGWGIFSRDFINLNSNNISGLYLISSCYPGNIKKNSLSRYSMIAKQKGTVNYVGSDISEYPAVSINMHQFLVKNICKGMSLGEALNDAKYRGYIIDDDFNLYKLLYLANNLQGDPSAYLPLYKNRPLSIVQMDSLHQGSGKFNVVFDNVPLDKSRLHIMVDDSLHASYEVTSKEQSFCYTDIFSDSIRTIITIPGYISKEKVYPVKEQFLSHKIIGVKFIDEDKSETLQSFEKFKIKLSLNKYQQDPLIVTAKFHSKLLTHHTISDTLYAGDSLIFNNKCDSSFLEDHNIKFDLSILDKNGYTSSYVGYLISCKNPQLEFVGVTIKDKKTFPVLYNNSQNSISNIKVSIYDEHNNILQDTLISKISSHKFKQIFDFEKLNVDTFRVGFKTLRQNFISKNIPLQESSVLDHEIIGSKYGSGTNFNWKIPQKFFVKNYFNDTSSNILFYSKNHLKNCFLNTKDDMLLQFYIIDDYNIIHPHFKKFTIEDTPHIDYYDISPSALYNPISYKDNLYFGNTMGGVFQWNYDYSIDALIESFLTPSNIKRNICIGNLDKDTLPDIISVNYQEHDYYDKDSLLVRIFSSQYGVLETKLFGYSLNNSPVIAKYSPENKDKILISTMAGDLLPSGGAFIYALEIKDSQIIQTNTYLLPKDAKYYLSCPSLVDIDNDGKEEIVVLGKHNIHIFEYGQENSLKSLHLSDKPLLTDPVFADIDNDNNLEIITISFAGEDGEAKLIARNYQDGNLIMPDKWQDKTIQMSKTGFYDTGTLPVVIDFDDNKLKDILVVTDKKIYLFGNDGQSFRGFPIDFKASTPSLPTPSVTDFDGDHIKDIILIADNTLYAYSSKNGSILPGFPLHNADINMVEGVQSPALFDINCDGKLDICIGSEEGKMLVCYSKSDINSRFKYDNFRGDVGNNGLFKGLYTGIEGQENILKPFKLISQYPNPFNPVTNFKFILEKQGYVNIEVYNCCGQKVLSHKKYYNEPGVQIMKIDFSSFSSGVFWTLLSNGKHHISKKIVMLK